MDEIDKKEQKQEQKIEESKEEVQKEFKGFFSSLKDFLTELLNIKVGTDKEATAQSIRDSIHMKGHTAWILVFSIFVASIGLNISSSAVVIGAMLISPLMGPILGIGFSVGINDIDTLKASMVNFVVMVVLSILTSFLFFNIPLFQQETPELISRTKPDVRDVLIAISGGLALFIAISRPTPQFNTVAGVAIATALMPPLCTAGFGLAIGNFTYFGGALFLFFINSTFIALAAFAITKYLRFPMVKYINQVKRKRISNFALSIASIIFLFSIYLFYQLFIENKYITQAESFIESIEDEGVNIIGEERESINYEENEIKLYVFGSEYDQKDINRWKNSLNNFGLENTTLTILQSHDDTKVRKDIDEIKSLYISGHKILSARDETITEKDKRIKELEKDLRKYYKNEILIGDISKEIHINYVDIEELVFAREFKTNFKKIDTIQILSVKWNSKINENESKIQEEKLKKWMETRLEIKNIEIRKLE
ncbi:MAG: DUF389 domain-containing protein [Bacteroidota bacterium]